MALTLSAAAAAQFAAASRALLSPLDGAAGDWQATVCGALRALFRPDHVLLLTPAGGALDLHADGLRPGVLETMGEFLTELAPGKVGNVDPLAEAICDARLARRVEAYSHAMLERVLDEVDWDAVPRSPYYNEVMAPARMRHALGLSYPLPLGETLVLLSYERGADADPFGEDGVQLLRMLLPAFKAGVDARVRYGSGADLDARIDALGTAAAVFHADGTEAHRTPALERLLAAELEGAWLRDELRRTALALRGGVGEARDTPATRGVATASAQYRLTVTVAPVGTFGRDGAVLVSVERRGRRPADEAALRTEFGLTRREAEIARLIAARAGTREIAAKLHLSTHTVRHHVESVRRKLGVHSRAAIAARVLG